MTTYPLISVIIPHYRRTVPLRRLLRSLSEQDYPAESYEIIVIADKGDDDDIHRLQTEYPNIFCLPVTVHSGAACAKNVGAHHARLPWLVFLDDDIILDPQWLRTMAAAATHDPAIACFQSKVLAYHDHTTLMSAGGVANIYGYAWDRGVYEKDNAQFDHDREIVYASSCAMMIRKSVFDAVGGFDNDIFFMGEDHDLGLRLWAAGEKVYYVPEAIAYHDGEDRHNDIDIKYYLERNRWYIIFKNYDLGLLVRLLLPLCLLKVRKYWSYLFRFRGKRLAYACSVIRGVNWMIVHAGLVRRLRRMVVSHHKEPIQSVFKRFHYYAYYTKPIIRRDGNAYCDRA